MAKDSYGTTQVREIRLDRREIQRIAADAFRHQGHTPYDFDYGNPIAIWESDGSLILRFVQSSVTRDSEARNLHFKTFDQIKAEAAKAAGIEEL